MEKEYSPLFASDHSFFQLNGSFFTISILQNSLLYAVRGRTVELTHEQNNLQQTARNNKNMQRIDTNTYT